MTGEAGGVRDKIRAAAFAYMRHVGTAATDIAALAAKLAEAALRHRSEGEVAGYGIPSLISWAMVRLAARERDARLPGDLLTALASKTRQPAGETPEEDPAAGEGAAAPEHEALPDFPPTDPDRDAALAA